MTPRAIAIASVAAALATLLLFPGLASADDCSRGDWAIDGDCPGSAGAGAGLAAGSGLAAGLGGAAMARKMRGGGRSGGGGGQAGGGGPGGGPSPQDSLSDPGFTGDQQEYADEWRKKNLPPPSPPEPDRRPWWMPETVHDYIEGVIEDGFEALGDIIEQDIEQHRQQQQQ